MQNNVIKKSMICGIMLLFFGAGVAPGIGNDIEKVNNVLDSDILNVNNGLVGYWSFDEDTGSIAHDDSGNGYDGTINDASWTTGISGNALNFDGINDYVGLGYNTFNSLTSGTVSAWIKLDVLSGSTAQPIFAGSKTDVNDDYFTLQETDNGKLVGFVKSGDIVRWKLVTDNSILTTDSWCHIVLVHDSITPKIYVNGDESPTSFVDTQDITQWFDDLQGIILWRIGYRHTAQHHYYLNGIIDEVRLYNRALSENEILDLFKEPFETYLFIGKISNLNTDTATITFDAEKLRIITFSPFQLIQYSSGEKIMVLDEYIGIITPTFAFGVFKANI